MIVLLATDSGQLVNSVMTAVFFSPSGPGGGSTTAKRVLKGCRTISFGGNSHVLTAVHTDDADPEGFVDVLVVDSNVAHEWASFQPLQHCQDVSRVIELVSGASDESFLGLHPEAVLVRDEVDWTSILSSLYLTDRQGESVPLSDRIESLLD